MENYGKLVIGILSQRIDKSGIIGKFPDLKSRPYIAVSYEKYVESQGAKTLLINCNISEKQARNIYECVNGLILPGGSASLKSSDYARIAALFCTWSKEDFDEKRRYFPIFGICLGFQFLLRQEESESNCLKTTMTRDFNLKLKFNDIAKESKMFGEKNMPENIYQILGTENVTFNYHKFSFLAADIDHHKRIAEAYHLLAFSQDPENGMEFVAVIEGMEVLSQIEVYFESCSNIYKRGFLRK